MTNPKIRKRIIITTVSIVVSVIYFFGVIFILSNNDNNSQSQTVDGTLTDGSLLFSTGDSFLTSSDSFNSIIETPSLPSSSNTATSSDLLSSNISSSQITSSIISASSTVSQEPTPVIPTKKAFTSAMWFSCFDDLNFTAASDFASFKANIDTMFDNAVALGNDAVICHVRPFADAYYPSSIFPWSSYITGTQGADPGYDPLDYMIKAAKQRNLQFHAWLNPYRISTTTDNPDSLAENHIARQWWNNPQKKRNILVLGEVESDKKGLYFNPTVPECRQLIISGIKEILDNYEVDGIHIDDYFYPTVNPEFDRVEYLQYQSTVQFNALSQDDWRRANVTALVQGIYNEVHRHSGVVFGISPSYHISNDGSDQNYTQQYADLAKWIANKGYIDYILPQLYFGYEHSVETARFDNSLNTWLSMPKHSSVKLYVGLGAYKIGLESDGGSDEWSTDTEILAKQAEEALDRNCDGVVIFNYSSLFADTGLAKTNLENLKQILKSE